MPVFKVRTAVDIQGETQDNKEYQSCKAMEKNPVNNGDQSMNMAWYHPLGLPKYNGLKAFERLVVLYQTFRDETIDISMV